MSSLSSRVVARFRKAQWEPPKQVTVTLRVTESSLESLFRVLGFLKDLGDQGSSRGVTVEGYTSDGQDVHAFWDGDGADRIDEVLLEGAPVDLVPYCKVASHSQSYRTTAGALCRAYFGENIDALNKGVYEGTNIPWRKVPEHAPVQIEDSGPIVVTDGVGEWIAERFGPALSRRRWTVALAWLEQHHQIEHI